MFNYCPLCRGLELVDFHQDKKRCYRQCVRCHLVFVPSEYHLNLDAEKGEYDKHQNSPDDNGYRVFLGRLFHPLNQLLRSNSIGLDFGCGPGPTLSVMFEERGHRVTLYDKFYYPDNSALTTTQYDFITATEVVEHLAQPWETFRLLWSILDSGGHLGLMTKLVESPERFSQWHYKNDPTHISFYSWETLLWLMEALQRQFSARVSLQRVANDAFIFSKE
ncbi:class I SAM-dependent methyltransferase [Teredinibacter sp. KSP-S5-2]|uniref:class I SAM-dependent methyltransferase n=1 Tax=Teredinibacter sp. KSP-S5-2 TaxID=3034506 RepID=UPI0029351201|nr:class I SAM-dependent methyltransferase [Teredinibacter sp. KSP-S5-2]WNO10901.1 class I SAM-dependent methyltransferase [Teredinibacter sp. KSP-S5-2]